MFVFEIVAIKVLGSSTVLACSCVCASAFLCQYLKDPEWYTAIALECSGSYRSGSPPGIIPGLRVRRVLKSRSQNEVTYQGAALGIRGFDVDGTASALDCHISRR
jgi:hypothetical protein